MLATVLVLIGLITPWSDKPVYRQLENGLNIYIFEDHALPLVSVQLWFAAGQAHDPPPQPGITAVAAALLAERGEEQTPESVEGTATKPVSAILDRDWGMLHDACYFSTIVKPEFVESALRREARRLKPCEIAEGDVRAALRQAAGRATSVQNVPDDLHLQRLAAALFANHPYRYPPGFVAEALRGMTPAELTEHLRSHFTPANATLFVIGDISAERIEKLAHECFDDLSASAAPPVPAFPRAAAETIRIAPHRTDEPSLTIAWRTAPLGFFENAAVDVLMERLCNSIDGRLCRRLVEMGFQPPTWRRWAASDAGCLYLTVVPRKGANAKPDWQATVGAIDEELAHAVAEIAAPVEHNRARALTGRRILDQRFSFAQRAWQIAEHQIVAGDFVLAVYATTRVAATGVDDVREAAMTLREARKVVSFPNCAPGDSVQEKLEAPLILSDSIVETPSIAYSRELPEEIVAKHEFRVNEQVQATILRTPGRPMAEIRTELSGEVISAAACRAALAAGSTLHTAGEIRDYLSYHGLDLSVWEAEGRAGFVTHGPSARVASMLELQWELLQRPASAATTPGDNVKQVKIQITADGDPEQLRGQVLEIWKR